MSKSLTYIKSLDLVNSIIKYSSTANFTKYYEEGHDLLYSKDLNKYKKVSLNYSYKSAFLH